MCSLTFALLHLCAPSQNRTCDTKILISILDPCEKNCVRSFKPVCGSDGQTYNNECLLEVAQCRTRGLRVNHRGPCAADREPQTGIDGPAEIKPGRSRNL